ncbi:MAG: hypothetical protein N2654_02635 [Deltaproteobacteria bacterium]|nr:hypothetical protein [Deltaproteobacteria bacterium]
MDRIVKASGAIISYPTEVNLTYQPTLVAESVTSVDFDDPKSAREKLSTLVKPIFFGKWAVTPNSGPYSELGHLLAFFLGGTSTSVPEAFYQLSQQDIKDLEILANKVINYYLQTGLEPVLLINRGDENVPAQSIKRFHAHIFVPSRNYETINFHELNANLQGLAFDAYGISERISVANEVFNYIVCEQYSYFRIKRERHNEYLIRSSNLMDVFNFLRFATEKAENLIRGLAREKLYIGYSVAVMPFKGSWLVRIGFYRDGGETICGSPLVVRRQIKDEYERITLANQLCSEFERMRKFFGESNPVNKPTQDLH